MRKIFWVLVTVLALTLTLPAAPPPGHGKPPDKGKPAETKGKPAEKAEEAKEKDKSKEEKEADERERQAAQGRAFGKEHEKSIRGWFGSKKNLKGLPPGLAKREELPPGLQRQLERNGRLPYGLQKRLEPLPPALEARLPKVPDGVKRGVFNGNVIIVEERTSRILDIIKDVIGVGGSEGSTGVRTKQ